MSRAQKPRKSSRGSRRTRRKGKSLGKDIGDNKFTTDDLRQMPGDDEEVPTTYRGITIRPEVMQFAMAMELKLAMHDEDRGDSWKGMFHQTIMDRMWDEYQELASASTDFDILDETVDVGAFCMFAWWTAAQRHVEAEFREAAREQAWKDGKAVGKA